MNQVDGVYENELGISFQVVLQNSYAGSDPYSGVTDPNSLLNEFRTVWNSQMTGVARDVAHLFTGRDLDGSVIGIAWIGVVCNNPAYAYGLSQRYGTSVQRYSEESPGTSSRQNALSPAFRFGAIPLKMYSTLPSRSA